MFDLNDFEKNIVKSTEFQLEPLPELFAISPILAQNVT